MTDFKDARCRQYEEATCGRGGYCNFMHLKKVSSRLQRRLLGRGEREDDRRRDDDRRRGDDPREVACGLKSWAGELHLRLSLARARNARVRKGPRAEKRRKSCAAELRFRDQEWIKRAQARQHVARCMLNDMFTFLPYSAAAARSAAVHVILALGLPSAAPIRISSASIDSQPAQLTAPPEAAPAVCKTSEGSSFVSLT